MKQHFVNQQTLKQLAYDNGLDLVPTWELDENLQTRYALIGFKSEAQIIERIQALKPGEVVVVAGNDHFVETLQTHVLNYRDSNGWLRAVALR